MRRTLGTAVFSGMLGVTLFGIFLTPVFFAVIDWLGGRALLPLPAACTGSAFSRLGIFALGFLWMLIRFLGNLRRARVAAASGQRRAAPTTTDQPH